MRILAVCLVISIGALSPFPVDASDARALELHYDKPATEWMTEALPIGNGYMGAMFFGAPAEEHIQFSEGTLWAGGPGAHPDYNFGSREGAAAHLEDVRTLLREDKLHEAHRLANKHLTGVIHKKKDAKLDFGDYGAQQTMGDLYVTVAQESAITDYQRSLDIETALGHVAYKAGDVNHARTYFGSYPHRSMAYRFGNDQPGGTNYTLRLETPHTVDSLAQESNIIRLKGHVADNGLQFETRIVVVTDGTLAATKDNRFNIAGARELTLYQFAHTAYRNDYPTYRGTDYIAENDAVQQQLAGLDYGPLKQAHIADYQALFNRVSLRLGDMPASSVTTDTRLRAYRDGAEDPALEVLLFQYARYLTIAASRPGTMPMHLQGKWNNSTNPPWAADYHTNINEQMLYWPAEVTNLTECHVPLLDYTASLVEPGRASSATHFGTRGWIVNTMNNAFGFTAPGWDFPWGFFPGGAGWLCQHLWEHYAYTGDETYLREQAYPVMKDAALFWIDYLQENAAGDLVSIPSYSPEHGGISAGASMDHQIAWDLLNNCVKAAEVLNIEDAFTKTARTVRDRISQPRIGRWGQLQEWIEDVDDPKNTHRHISHLFALYPGAQINLSQTPAWAEAAKTSLEARGNSGSGWSIAWKVNFWARLRDGDRAHALLRNVLQLTDEKRVVMEKAGGVYQNLFCAHPPFQLDGNMGAAAGMAEMLLQSHAGEIHLLPALPAAWDTGQVQGLVARGGHTIDMAWEGAKLISATIHWREGSTCPVRYGEGMVHPAAGEKRTTLSAMSFTVPGEESR
jgi:alpha-L-fucosidase 2